MNTRAQLIQLPIRSDERGSLTFGQVGDQLPFTPVRYFVISGAPRHAVRGRHAHLKCQELIIVVHGSCTVRLVDRAGRDEVTLDSPTVGLHLPPLIWIEQSDFGPETVVLVLASETYDEGDYVRSLPQLLEGGRA